MSDVDSFSTGNSLLSRGFYSVVRTLLLGIFLLLTRVKVYGKQNIPAHGPFVLAPVHRSNVDTPLASTVTHRRMRFMGKDSLWKSKPIGVVFSALGGFPISRGTADREALSRCIAVLKSGQPLCLFPEGERKSGPIVQPLFDGAAYVALKAGVPIIPVGIGGSEGVMTKGSKMIHPRKCVIIVGEPIFMPNNTDGPVPRSVVHELSWQLHAELQRLFDEAQYCAGTPNQ
ncbi:MAG: 1-acyl-sn-glycerol-3-phosphate acyltransferase [Ilumatobacteraceae bacterium]|nr:1-acyl-sn-glycerol-3-phosphate acyltransferase [Ilumatobacteraceae bacterium]